MATALPFLKFFPRDWLGDQKLSMCSLPARGLWMEMLCVMHLNTRRRGYLETASGQPVTASQLARSARIGEGEAESLVAELRAADVFSVGDDGVIYSRRMVREQRFRDVCSDAGKRSASRAARRTDGGFAPRSTQGDTQGDTQGSGQGASNPQTADSRLQKNTEDPPNPPLGESTPTPSRIVKRKPDPDPPESVPIPLTLDVPEFQTAWAGWKRERAARRQRPYTPTGEGQQLAKLAGYGVAASLWAIGESTRNGWQGLFPEKFRDRGGANLDRGAQAEARILSQIQDALGAP